MLLEDLIQLPEEELHALYEEQIAGSKEEALIEEAFQSYHPCDVCGVSYPIEEPCEFH